MVLGDGIDLGKGRLVRTDDWVIEQQCLPPSLFMGCSALTSVPEYTRVTLVSPPADTWLREGDVAP